MDDHKDNRHGDPLHVTAQQQGTIIDVDKEIPKQEQHPKKKQAKVVGVLKVKAVSHQAIDVPATVRVKSDVRDP